MEKDRWESKVEKAWKRYVGAWVTSLIIKGEEKGQKGLSAEGKKRRIIN